MPSGRKDDKQQAANNPNPNRNYVQNLPNLMARPWVKATLHILIPQGHSNKHKNR
ncbi:hypothetical protein RHMOL_Rhmol11G0184900 [Rhododendron molle]|uniref:Uncharacterized protein n=1 Tax=Rhododendron molle TaxID=49168 RepID=A0ACC0LUX2_RHOML|nr:hypothetical protein RHMOL_Rhmol11G0184900 [Rhododendron molle]